MRKRIRVQSVGVDDEGDTVFEVDSEGDPSLKDKFIKGRPAVPGKPILPGRQIGHLYSDVEGRLEIEPLDTDSKTIEFEDCTAGKGPVKVASDAYRSGWDRIWGAN